MPQQCVGDWRKASARHDSEPETAEGRKELAARAKQAGAKPDRALAAHHHHEVGSAAAQIAIVLASASIITGPGILVWGSGAFGVAAVALRAIGSFRPTAVHQF